MARRSASVVKSTVLEILSEPLTLLLLLTALALTVLAPAFHYHQFGEPTRMARDAGLSALLTCGGLMAVLGVVRSFRREIETGTMAMALVHPLSRSGFFLSKVLGAFAAYLVFAATVFFVTMTIVEGAAVGGALARKTGDIARLWGPCLAAGVGVMVLPLAVGAVCNRFLRCRFVLTALVCALVLSALPGGAVAVVDGARMLRLLPVALLIVVGSAVPIAASAAFAVRLRAPAALSAVAAVVAAALPAFGNYYLSDALSGGGSVPWRYAGLAVAAVLPAIALFLWIGVRLLDERKSV